MNGSTQCIHHHRQGAHKIDDLMGVDKNTGRKWRSREGAYKLDEHINRVKRGLHSYGTKVGPGKRAHKLGNLRNEWGYSTYTINQVYST